MFKSLLDRVRGMSNRNAAIVFICIVTATIALAAGYERIAKDKLILGTGTGTTKTLEFDIGNATNPAIRVNGTSEQLEYTNDGTNFLPIGSGTGGAGGTNTLVDPGFEAGGMDWTNSGATYSITTTTADVGAGTKAAAWDASASGQTLTSGQQDVPAGLYGRDCVASVWYKGAGPTVNLEVIDSVPTVLAAVQLPQVASTYTRAQLTFTCPTSGTFAIRLYSTGNPAAGYFDEFFLGEKEVEKEFVNYAKDPFFMKGGLDYTTYNDGAAAPVDGTGGLVSNMSIAIDSTTPLRYLRHLVLTKDAANDQGEGMAYDFKVDRADNYPNPKVINVSFDYETSANFDCGDPLNPADPSDVTVWIYDKDGSEIMQMSPWILDCTGRYQGYFQANYNHDDYRLIFHITTTNALAWTFKITNIKIGKVPQAFGPAVKDYVSFTPVINSNTNVTENVGYWARVGDTLFMHGHIKYGGVGDASTIYVSLPSGMTLDTSKFSTDTGENNLGHGMWRDSGVAVYTLIALYNASNQIYFNQTGLGPALQSNSMTSGDSVVYQLIVPITGWSSNTSLNTGGAHNEVEVIAYLTASQSIPTASSTVLGTSTNTTIYKDNRGAMSTSGVFTAPFSGFYVAMLTLVMELSTDFSGTDTEHWKAWSQDTDGNQFYFFDYIPRSISASESFGGSTLHYLKAGDTLRFFVYQNSGNARNAIGTSSANTRMSIVKYSGSSIVQSGEGLTFFAHKTGGNQSVTSGSDDKVSYQTEDWDDYGQYDATTNYRFNVQNPGKYRCTQCFKTTYGAGVTVSAPHFLKNGTNTLGYFYKYVTAGNQDAFCNSLPMKLLAGDYIESYYYSGGGTTTVESHATNRATTFSCERIGN